MDSNGGGQWSSESISANSIFPSLVRPTATNHDFGKDMGFSLGGYYSHKESDAVKGYVPVPGLVSYNISSGVWSNTTATGFTADGTAQYGIMQFVPSFGQEGLLVVLGGETSNLVAWTDTGSNLLSFEDINIYDVAEGKWYTQKASGTIPAERDRFCAVGVPGDNGTYEIFIFGGHVANPNGDPASSASPAQAEVNIALDEVSVLTLPGFYWAKATYEAKYPRTEHSCNLVGHRQMLVIGGYDPSRANSSDKLKDPWSQGLGIFDLTDMRWKDGYNANAGAYTSPDNIKGYYQERGLQPVDGWDSSDMQALFNTSASPCKSQARKSARQTLIFPQLRRAVQCRTRTLITKTQVL